VCERDTGAATSDDERQRSCHLNNRRTAEHEIFEARGVRGPADIYQVLVPAVVPKTHLLREKGREIERECARAWV
jgi:hypothetical protein